MSPTLLLGFALALHAATERVESSSHGHVEINNLRLPSSKLPYTIKEHNMSIYIDKTENILRVPDLKKNYEEHTTKRKNKKSPKRTVQKIIKKNKIRRKMYLNKATLMPTKPPTADELEQFYAKEELQQKNENFTTAQEKNPKKRRKWNVARYPMPFQHMVSTKDHKRNKREDREDVFIFTDLNEMEFLKDDKDENVINAHIKKYW